MCVVLAPLIKRIQRLKNSFQTESNLVDNSEIIKSMSNPLRLMLVDDDPFTRLTLCATLTALEFSNIAQAATVAEAISVAADAKPQVAILDLDLGEGPTGIDLAHRLREISPRIGIVVLSTYTEPRLIGSKQQAMPDRAIYVVKQSITSSDMLLDAITKSLSSVAFLSESIAPPSPLAEFGDTQVEIMRLISAGMSNAEISESLFMQEGSVEKAIARLIKKLGIKATRKQNQRVLIAQEYYRLTKNANEPH